MVMKHVFSTIAFALLLSANQVVAFDGGCLMEQSQGNAQAQVDKKAGQKAAAQKAKADEAKKTQDPNKNRSAPATPKGGTNDAQLMTDEANADRQANRERGQGSQQQQPQQQGQQNGDPSQQGVDTTAVDTTAKNDAGSAAQTANGGKDEDSKVFLSGNMKMWIIVAVAVIVIIYFASRKKTVNNRRHAEPAEEEPSADKKLIDTLRERIAGLEAEREELRQQNTGLNIELDNLRARVASNSNMQPQTQNNVAVNRKSSSMELYANILNGMVFPVDDLQPTRDEYTVFVLNVSGNEGTFKVNDAANAQLYLISNFAYSVASAVEVKSKEMSAKAIVTLEPGRVRKTSSGWTIIKKAVVELK